MSRLHPIAYAVARKKQSISYKPFFCTSANCPGCKQSCQFQHLEVIKQMNEEVRKAFENGAHVNVHTYTKLEENGNYSDYLIQVKNMGEFLDLVQARTAINKAPAINRRPVLAVETWNSYLKSAQPVDLDSQELRNLISQRKIYIFSTEGAAVYETALHQSDCRNISSLDEIGRAHV